MTMLGSAAEVRGVLLSEVSPLLGYIILSEDRGNRAGGNACATVDALDRINEELIGCSVAVLVFLGVDAIDWTSVYAGGVLSADTGFSDYIGHFELSAK
jgi:hypothetical protein